MYTQLPAGSAAAARRVTGSCRDFTLYGVKFRVVCQGNLEIGLESDAQVGLLAIFMFTSLPFSKNEYIPQALQRAATEAIKLSEEPGCTSYFTDGTVHPDTNTTGTAVYSCLFTLMEEIKQHLHGPNSASTMQTELLQFCKHSFSKVTVEKEQ